MMKARIAIMTAAVALAVPLAHAQPTKDALADVMPGTCTETPAVPEGTTLSASWSWVNGTFQNKFGGDAEYQVSYSDDGEVTWMEIGSVEFSLTRYEEDMTEEEAWGKLIYECSPDVTEVEGDCNGTVGDVVGPISEAVAEYFGGEVPAGVVVQAELEGVKVKAMNPPGKGKGKSQKYPLVDVCGEDAIVIP